MPSVSRISPISISKEPSYRFVACRDGNIQLGSTVIGHGVYIRSNIDEKRDPQQKISVALDVVRRKNIPCNGVMP